MTWVAELVTDGVNGLLVAPGDPRALRDAIARITADPRLAMRLGAAARSTAESYAWERVLPRLAASFGELSYRTAIAPDMQQLKAEHVFREFDTVNDVRGHFIGHRTMKSEHAKEETMQRCRALDWPVNDHNAADACALWDYACCLIDPKLGIKRTPMFWRTA